MVKRKIIPYFFTYFTKLSWNHSVVRFLFFSDQTFPSSWGFLDSSVGKESTCNAGGPGSIPRSRRSIGEGIGYPLQHSWASLVVQLLKNLPAGGRPGFCPWVGIGRREKLYPWRRERLPTPVFCPREFHGLYSP